MKRSMMTAAILLAAAATATEARAFNAGSAWLGANAVHTFFLSNTLATDLTWSSGNAMTMSQLVLSADQAAQQWNVAARVNLALAVEQTPIAMGSVPSSFGNANGRNDIYARPVDSSNPLEAGAAAYTWCLNNASGGECDIILMTNATWRGINTPNGSGQVSFNDIDQTFAHEMGHALGLYHPASSLCDTSSGGNPAVLGALMCPSPLQRHYDHPSVDDIDGVRSVSGYSQVNRNVGIMKGTVDAAGVITWDEDFSAVAMQSLVRPRIACRRGGEAPDCVVTTTDAANNVRLSAITWNNPWQTTAQTVMANASRHEIDVAVGAMQGGTTRAVITRMADLSSDFRAWWGSWDMTSSGGVTQGTFGTGTGASVNVREPPRVSYHATVGDASGTGAFVAVLLDQSRNFRVAVSTDASGLSWSNAAAVSFTDGVTRRGFGHYDVSCPVHQSTVQECRVVFNARTTPGTSGNTASADLSATQTACSFTVASGTHTVSAWRCNLADKGDPMQVSLSDYGDTPPSGGFSGVAWLLSVSRASPIDNVNTATIFNSNAAPSIFKFPDRDVDLFDTPFQLTSPPPFSLWGGVSCDWVDFKHTFACVQLKESSRW